MTRAEHDLARQLDGLGKSYHAMIEVPVERLDRARHAVLRHFAGKRLPGIVILFTIPYAAAKLHLENEGHDTSSMFFIDCLTTGYASPRETNVAYLGEMNLTDIAIAVGQFAETISGEKYLVVDSLNTLLIYHDDRTAAKFVNALTVRAGMLSMQAAFFAIKGKDPGFIETIYPFFDKVIDYG